MAAAPEDGNEAASRDAAIDAMLAKEALRDLAVRYARAVDRRDLELLRSVYHDGATDEHGLVYSGPASGFVDRFMELMLGFELTAHFICNASYRVAGHRADGELYFLAYHRTLGDDPKHVMVSGRYLDNYERRRGEWRIAQRKLVWDSALTLPVDPADAAQLAALGEVGRWGEGDYSYRALPLMRRGA
ncbi:nuclear transport factor 2 family protein [Rhizorhabdus argentea]|uniref:nuclear transport factor 2 family protein n=1 Tax=Rhizorhabdus argentea TaxID=1387174 RepID=UPI0030EB7D9E